MVTKKQLFKSLDNIERWREFISKEHDLQNIRVHPFYEQFARMLLQPRYDEPLPTCELIVSRDQRQNELHLIYTDTWDVVYLGG